MATAGIALVLVGHRRTFLVSLVVPAALGRLLGYGSFTLGLDDTTKTYSLFHANYPEVHMMDSGFRIPDNEPRVTGGLLHGLVWFQRLC